MADETSAEWDPSRSGDQGRCGSCHWWNPDGDADEAKVGECMAAPAEGRGGAEHDEYAKPGMKARVGGPSDNCYLDTDRDFGCVEWEAEPSPGPPYSWWTVSKLAPKIYNRNGVDVWDSSPNPMLDGLTPREAFAVDPERVIALVETLAQGTTT